MVALTIPCRFLSTSYCLPKKLIFTGGTPFTSFGFPSYIGIANQAIKKHINHIYKSTIEIIVFETDGNTHNSNMTIKPVIVKAVTCQTK